MKHLLSFLLLAVMLTALVTGANAQTNLYTQDFGTLTGPLPSGWTATSGTGTWATTTSAGSSGYTGSSGGANLIGTNGAAALTHIVTLDASISTVGYAGITVFWGARRTASFTNNLTFEWSDNGTTWNEVTYSNVSANATWALVNSGTRINLPAGAAGVSNLRFRWSFTQIAGTGNYRIDDFTVEGSSGSVNDGDGTATVVNNAGTFLNSTIFNRNTGGQSVLVTVTGVGVGNLASVRLTLPSGWSGLSAPNVTLGGAFTSLTPGVTSTTVTITGATLGITPGTIAITGLTSNNPVGALNNGNSAWLVETATSGGTLTAIANSPRSHTIIPIENIRTGGVDGFGNSNANGTTSAMDGQTVAVQGIATVQNQIVSSSATQTSFFIQQSGFGLQVFRFGAPVTTWARGDEIVVKGLITMFGGTTEVVPQTGVAPNFYNIGAGSLPAPLLLLNANAIGEQYEGRLARVNSVTWDSAGSTFTSAGGPRNSFRTAPTDTGTLLVTSTNPINGTVIPASGNVIGIVYHRSDLQGVAQPPHRLVARDLVDLGFDPADGTGTATITPPGRVANQVAVAETLTVTGDGVQTLGGVSVTIPATWGWNGTSRTLSGAGFSSATSSVTGDGSGGNPYVITVSSAAVTGANPGVIRIFNLNTPATTGLTTFITRTRGASGALANIAAQPTVNIGSAFEATASGNWSSPSTWAGGAVPTASDNVTMTTLGVTVTIDIDGAVCNNLTLTGSGTAPNSGPVLQFDATGTRSLTVNGNLTAGGGTGGGSGDRGGRPRLWDNGNNTITLTVKKNITNTSSNTVANGNAGISMNLGVVRMTGATQDTVRLGAGMRLGSLQVGDGTDAKTVYTAITTTSARLALISLEVRTNSALWIGTSNNTNVLTVGNSVESGVPVMNGGINIATGASLRVQESTAGFVQANINLNGGSITNNGTLDLLSLAARFTELTGCQYNVRVGGHPAGAAGGTITVGGANAGEFANVSIDSGKTLALNQDMLLASFAKVTINNGTLAETDGNTVIGTVEATRTVTTGVPETFGGMGLEINAAGSAPGSTVATRKTGNAITSGGSQSILRNFNITPTTNTGLNATLNFYYDNSELNGNVAGNLQLYKSTDAGATWGAQGGAVNVGLKQIQLTGVPSLSRWTAADDNNPLGGFSVPVSTFDGWNMISNPVMTAQDSVRQLYPNASFNYAFSFAQASGYQQQYRLLNGVGYWEKFSGPHLTSVFGAPRTIDSIAIAIGWNMIGSISSSVSTASITQVPGGIITTGYFSYDPGYNPATTIQPGKGYWVKAVGAGIIILNSAAPAKPADPTVNAVEEFSAITITDSRGFSQTLRIGEDMTGEFPIERYEMPPQGPEGTFDVRFASQRAVEVYASRSNGSYPVMLKSVVYPVTVSWTVRGGADRTFTLNDGTNEKKMSGSGQATLKQVAGGQLVISSKVTEIPTEFSLAPNYPNPFNPATTIRFGLPQEARVSLRVFNLLGQQVAELSNGVLEAGYQEFVWDGKTSVGTSAGSGVYFYKIEATSTADGRTFSEVRKMLLLK